MQSGCCCECAQSDDDPYPADRHHRRASALKDDERQTRDSNDPRTFFAARACVSSILGGIVAAGMSHVSYDGTTKTLHEAVLQNRDPLDQEHEKARRAGNVS